MLFSHLTSSTLLGRLHAPWIVRSPEFMQNYIVRFGIDVLGINEETVNVKDAGANGWKAIRVGRGRRHAAARKLDLGWGRRSEGFDRGIICIPTGINTVILRIKYLSTLD